MKRLLKLLAGTVGVVLLALTVVSCKGAKSGRGFHLPDGDADKGRAAFVQLGCNQCHTVSGVELAAPSAPGLVQVKLGGEVLRVKTYGQLVTSIIDPSHVSSPQHLAKLQSQDRPPMPEFTNTMTVRQMIDIVAFLHGSYTKVMPEYQDYSYPYGFSGAPGLPGPTPFH
jgi:mono/diheme cytochrome c family protein